MLDEDAPALSPLVRALTRAPTLFGVPYMFSMFNMVATATIFLATKSYLPFCLHCRSIPSAIFSLYVMTKYSMF